MNNSLISLEQRPTIWDRFDDMFKHFDAMFTNRTYAYTASGGPRYTGTYENDGYTLLVETPGYAKGQLKITEGNGTIAIRGDQPNGKSFDFFLFLGEQYDMSKTVATYTDGVLRVRLYTAPRDVKPTQVIPIQ